MTEQWSVPAWLVVGATIAALLATLVAALLAALATRAARRAAAARAEADARVADLQARVEELAHTLEQVAERPASRPEEPEFVITRLGEERADQEPVPAVPAPLFADLVLRESVVQAAALAQGLRRALAPETRNRIRFEMRREVKRARKARRTEIRQARRAWAARERAEMAG